MIFIVEDDGSVRASLLRLVNSAGLAARAFATAEEFLQVAAPQEGDCVVIDVHLPGMNGLELQRELGRRGQAPAAVVMITAFDDPAVRREALDGGALALLTKPFSDSALLQLVSGATRTRPGKGKADQTDPNNGVTA